MPTANLDLLIEVAQQLRPLLHEVVFLGGCTTELFVTDLGAAGVRPTNDVDVVIEVTSYVAYCDFSKRLRDIGFSEDSSDKAPMCRWLFQGKKLDVMPMEEKILGYSNRWYPAAIKFADDRVIAPDLKIRLITAPYFIGTKLAAFEGRGHGDYQSSSDLEDIIVVLDGRATIVADIKAQEKDLQSYIALKMKNLRANAAFIDSLPGYLQPDSGSQERLPIIVNRIRELSEI